MVSKIIKKINLKLKLLYRKNRFLTPKLQQLLCNAIIQQHFDCACSAWYPSLNQKRKAAKSCKTNVFAISLVGQNVRNFS